MGKQYRSIGLFLLIAFVLPLAAAMQLRTDNALLRFVFFGIEAASPSIAAAAMLMRGGRYRDFGREMFHKKHLRMAIFLPTAVAMLTMFGAKLLFCAISGNEFALGRISGGQFIVIAWAFVAEELGWRGYLEPSLTRVDWRLVPAIVGVVWCLWHYHYFWLGRIQIPVFLFLTGCVVESYVYSILMDWTQSNLLSAMTYHFAWNLSIHLFAINPSENCGSLLPYRIMLMIEITVLFLFLLAEIMRKYKLRRGPYG